MRIATMILCKYMEDYLVRVARECCKYSEIVLVMNSKSDWPGIINPIEDMTEHVFKSEFDNCQVQLVRGTWTTEEHQRNVGLEMLSEFNFVMIVEADEFLLEDDFKLFHDMLDGRHDAYLAKPMLEYWKDENHILDPLRTYEPIIAVNPRKAKFYDKRCASVRQERFRQCPIDIHHMSYCFPDFKMKWKMQNWWDSNNGRINYNWYEEKWLKWDNDKGIDGLYMSHPEWGTKAVPCVPPVALIDALKK